MHHSSRHLHGLEITIDHVASRHLQFIVKNSLDTFPGDPCASVNPDTQQQPTVPSSLLSRP